LEANVLDNKVYNYDTPNTDITVYDNGNAFTNTKAPLCGITGCTLWLNDCVTAIPAPMNTFVTVEANSPWNIKVSQTK